MGKNSHPCPRFVLALQRRLQLAFDSKVRGYPTHNKQQNRRKNDAQIVQDADFAAETANLTRAQILVQSGTSVLQISNQSPQQVLALLKGR